MAPGLSSSRRRQNIAHVAKFFILKKMFIADRSVDGLISTMALHHLPTVGHLEACFAEIRRVLKPEGAVYLADFGRLRSLKSVLFFAYMNAKAPPRKAQG